MDKEERKALTMFAYMALTAVFVGCTTFMLPPMVAEIGGRLVYAVTASFTLIVLAIVATTDRHG